MSCLEPRSCCHCCNGAVVAVTAAATVVADGLDGCGGMQSSLLFLYT